MQVKSRMTPNPITTGPKTTYNQAFQLMKENHIQHLPIIDKNGAMVGIVSQSDMLSAKPSRVTTLSMYEIVSLLDTVTMVQIMSKPVLAVDEKCSLSNAARFMIDHEIGCLPVMREAKLVGIITDTDIFGAFVEVSGGGQPGSRLEVKMPDVKGELAKITHGLAEAGSYIVSLTISYDDTGDYAFADIKERGGDDKRLREEMDKINIEIINFRPSEDDQLLRFS
jgi:acetoin utilization protein AcuB